MTELELLKKAIEEFQNEGDDEWGLDVDEINHFIYWLENQERYQNIRKHFFSQQRGQKIANQEKEII